MKQIFFLLGLIFCIELTGQEIVQLRNMGGQFNGYIAANGKEIMSPMGKDKTVYNVTEPSLTVFKPENGFANGTAVVICPGGAFHMLSIDNEGNRVAEWLTKKGVTCFVLRYRLVPIEGNDPFRVVMTTMANREKLEQVTKPVIPQAIEDGMQALRYVKDHAEKYKIDQDRIGIIGFSAGGTIAAAAGLRFTDDIKPAFIAPIYAYLGELEKAEVPKNAPPLFVAAATDDPLGFAAPNTQLYLNWIRAAKPAELHVYSKGGHGFGMRKQNKPSDDWIDRFGEWLKSLKLLN